MTHMLMKLAAAAPVAAAMALAAALACAPAAWAGDAGALEGGTAEAYSTAADASAADGQDASAVVLEGPVAQPDDDTLPVAPSPAETGELAPDAEPAAQPAAPQPSASQASDPASAEDAADSAPAPTATPAATSAGPKRVAEMPAADAQDATTGGLAGETEAVQDGKAGTDAKSNVKVKVKTLSRGTYSLVSHYKKKLALTVGKAREGSQLKLAKKSSRLSQRFYVRDEGDGRCSLQSVSAGMFLADVEGKIVLMPWADGDETLLWGGKAAKSMKFLNAATGRALALKGKKAVAVKPRSSKAQKWLPTKTKLLKGGFYALAGSDGGRLSVAGASFKKGANVQVEAEDASSGAQSFSIQVKGGSYRLVNTKSWQAVAVKGSSKKKGATVVQQPVSSKDSQLWKAGINRDGSFTFTNVRSGKALQAAPTGDAVQGNPDSSPSQAWRLSTAKCHSVSGDRKLDKKLAAVLATHGTLRDAYNCIRDDYKWAQPDTAYRSGKYMSDSNTKRYAREMLAKGKGSCYCTSSTVMWLARALGYRANVTVGYLYSNIPGVIGAHSWVEVRKGSAAYICDADCERGLPGHDFFMRTYANAPVEYHFW